jgi:acylphosphatase
MEKKALYQIHFRVQGKVQGVGFRYYTRKVARKLGVKGWVTNLLTGEVEVLGEGERDILDQLIETCKKGPSGAQVTSFTLLKNESIEALNFPDFTIE